MYDCGESSLVRVIVLFHKDFPLAVSSPNNAY